MEINFLIAFLSGLIIGGTPCILLMLSAFGTSLVLVEEKNKFFIISFALIFGMIIMYILISILVLYVFGFLTLYFYFKYVFAGILIIIGAWQIIDCKKEKSMIFGTPDKVKTIMKDFIEKRSGIYAFLVGMIFVLIKIPCFGGVYIIILYSVRNNPLLYLFIFAYLLGMIIPIIIILCLLRVSLESSQINEFRLKYRMHLRIISGAVLIFLAIYLIVLNDLLFS